MSEACRAPSPIRSFCAKTKSIFSVTELRILSIWVSPFCLSHPACRRAMSFISGCREIAFIKPRCRSIAGDEPSSPLISTIFPRPFSLLAMKFPISHPASKLSAPMKAVYFRESVFRSNRITGIPRSYASSMADEMVCNWLGETIRRSIPSRRNRRICRACNRSSSLADANLSLTLSC